MRKYSGIFLVVAAIVLPAAAASSTSPPWNMWGLKATSEFSACQGI